MTSQLADEVRDVLQAIMDGTETLTASREAIEIATELVARQASDLIRQRTLQAGKFNECKCDGSNCVNCANPKPACILKRCRECGDCFMGNMLPETKMAIHENVEPQVNLTSETLRHFGELITGKDPSAVVTDMVENAWKAKQRHVMRHLGERRVDGELMAQSY